MFFTLPSKIDPSLILVNSFSLCFFNSISDIAVANDLIYSAAKGASYNVLINLSSARTKDKEKYKNSVEYYIKQIEDVHLKISTITNSQLDR